MDYGAIRLLKLRKFILFVQENSPDRIETSGFDSSDTEPESTVECTPPYIAVDGYCSKYSQLIYSPTSC